MFIHLRYGPGPKQEGRALWSPVQTLLLLRVGGGALALRRQDPTPSAHSGQAAWEGEHLPKSPCFLLSSSGESPTLLWFPEWLALSTASRRDLPAHSCCWHPGGRGVGREQGTHLAFPASLSHSGRRGLGQGHVAGLWNFRSQEPRGWSRGLLRQCQVQG